MTQSVHITSKLPNLSAPFHGSTDEETDQGGSYSVQTPYGFQLDLDFLKYVEEIESGHNIRRANVNPRRGSRGDRGYQRNLNVGGRTSGWTSTESLSSTTSENGQTNPPFLQSPITSPSKPLSTLPVISPSLPTCSKVPPPPPPRNPRVERTLLETSLRLQQEQKQFSNGLGSNLLSSKASGSKRDFSLASSQLASDAHLLQISPVVQNPLSGVWTRASPQTSGRSTPASNSGTLPPGHLQTVREQMANALRQLREMEERVKRLPTLEREVAMLRAEKERLAHELQKKTEELDATLKLQVSTEAVVGASQPGSLPLPSLWNKKPECKSDEQDKKEIKKLATAPIEKRSIAVGGDSPLEAVVVFNRQAVKDAAVEATIDVCHAAIETETSVMHDEAIQTGVATEDVAVWVTESFLGLQSETEREIDNLQHTIKFQQESIQVLETRLTQVNQDLEALRAQEIERASKIMLDKETVATPETANAQMETCPEVCSVGVLFPDVTDPEYVSKKDQSIQTDPVETSKEKTVELVSIGIQWECLTDTQDTEEQTTSAEAAGPLKSIMKRKDGSGAGAASIGGKKSLKFVGILNGGYESTSSEEEKDEESSSDGSEAGACSDSSVEEGAALEDTSDEEMNINVDETDSDENMPAGSEDLKDQEEEVKEKFELSAKMREACLILKNHLNDGAKSVKSKEVLSSTHSVQLEWFRVSSAKMAQPSRVSNYLMAFSEVSPVLLEHIANMTDGNGNTALHYSVSHSNFTVVDLLLDTGMCNVDQQNKAGYTAVMLAALSAVKEEDDMAVVQKLFRLGNVNAKASQAGQTALMLAVSHGRQEMVRALLDCAADVNIQDDEGSTALMCASEHGRPEIVSLLLEQPGCDISVVDNDGSNALSIALEASHNDIAVLLYSHMNYSKTQADVASKANSRSPSSPRKTWPSE
ncbi:KN motif and ankyrin repeat domain-containing protein 3 [Sinocyclocheilus rhinocerous]|uniref:KN motif and ankyrin repeat domain-containing protein 3-like n=1 Tax=Sinocyclocheilus rhinocerous TaxID=307959 RepID=A0A673HD57_9TELE|nr:PREDICTED: KN motif and ankyrin repeat domain-containing protein 3-like [Sinocyclocheilus rhinocerous]